MDRSRRELDTDCAKLRPGSGRQVLGTGASEAARTACQLPSLCLEPCLSDGSVFQLPQKCPSNNHIRGFPDGLVVKNPPANGGDTGDIGLVLGRDDSPEKEMAACSSILAWKIW